MDPENEQIQLDDITFDDVIAGEGVETIAIDDVDTNVEDKEQELPIQEEEVVEQEQKQEDPEEDIKEESKEDDDESDEDSTVVSEILSAFGYESEGDYDDTSEGLINMTKDIAGQLSEYFNLKGHDKSFTSEMINDYADSGKLHAKAESARQALGKVQAQQQSQLVNQQKEERAQEYQNQQQFWGDVAKTLEDSQEFAGVTVPEREKSKFFNYLSRPVNQEGLTQRDIDHSEAEMDKKLAIDYLMFKGFNLDQIINTKARSKNSRSLKDKISRNQDTVKNARKSSRRTKSFDIDELDLSI